jgi:hypothetical protein
MRLAPFYPFYSNNPKIYMDTVLLHMLSYGMNCKRTPSLAAPSPGRVHPAAGRRPTSRVPPPITYYSPSVLPPDILAYRSEYLCATAPADVQPPLHFARPNSPRINTSANPSFFIKSLIMNDFKSNRISERAYKSSRINTSEMFSCKPFRINTSRNRGGRGRGAPGRTARHAGHTRRASVSSCLAGAAGALNRDDRGRFNLYAACSDRGRGSASR